MNVSLTREPVTEVLIRTDHALPPGAEYPETHTALIIADTSNYMKSRATVGQLGKGTFDFDLDKLPPPLR